MPVRRGDRLAERLSSSARPMTSIRFERLPRQVPLQAPLNRPNATVASGNAVDVVARPTGARGDAGYTPAVWRASWKPLGSRDLTRAAADRPARLR